MSRKREWAVCKGCGGPVRSNTKYGYCVKNPECRRVGGRLRSQAATRAPRDVESTREVQRRANAKYHRNNPWVRMWNGARIRAEKLGVPFTITQEHVKEIWTDTCPVFGEKLGSGTGKVGRWSPSLDRITPELGYVPGNIQILSMRANSMKSDATAEELRQFAEWVLSGDT